MRIAGAPAEVAEVLIEEWTPLGQVTSKSMFGGVGLFCDGVMFTIIDKQGTVYLRSDETTDAIFEAAGSRKHGMPYWLVPASVMGDHAELLSWARRAVRVANANKK
ncbi:MAG: TfoX/Sxy family protein [Acidimicrobiia bacterium]|nr:TfoX/Sxy family protein [Acidimicrobiia bacterium]MDH5420499.1 TfoX/Sxy family protein [Acidimicrobiia bacterium]MDH5504591.1 TfoX/Sxy family protein [Acidimicrobiia bacterium]